MVPSIFTENDYKRHMSINTDTGLWQCFQSGNRGNFFQLYAFLEGVTYNKAESDLTFASFLSNEKPPKPKVSEPITCPKEDLGLVPVTLESHDSSDDDILRAWSFLMERRLFNEKTLDSVFYLSKQSDSRYEGRLIIPFVEDDELFYFQARSLDGRNPKYLNPSKGWPKGSNLLYPFDEDADKVYVCEGPLDAISMQNAGVNATCTLGSSVSDTQIELLMEFDGKVVIAYDNDEAGRKGANKFDYLRRVKRMTDLYICHPPKEVKDWNEALVKGIDLKQFVDDHTKKYDYDYLIDHLLTTL